MRTWLTVMGTALSATVLVMALVVGSLLLFGNWVVMPCG